MKKLKKHLVKQFVAGYAITMCGFYVGNEHVTAYRKYATCKNCGKTK